MLQPHTLRPASGAKHRVKRVGRGNASGHGTSSTRGGKGQTARSGGSRGLARLGFRRVMQSAPKLRGFRSLNEKPAELFLADLEKYFDDGATVTLAVLQEMKLLGGNIAAAKIIGGGKLTKKFIVEGIGITKSAAAIIKAVGGEVK